MISIYVQNDICNDIFLQKGVAILYFDQHYTIPSIDLDKNVQFWLKHMVATLYFDPLTKMCLVVNITCKSIKN